MWHHNPEVLMLHTAYSRLHLGFEHRYHCSGWWSCCLFYWAGAGQEIDLELVIEADEPAHVEETIFCDLNYSSAPVYVYVKASFEVSTHKVSNQNNCVFSAMQHNVTQLPLIWQDKEAGLVVMTKCVHNSMDVYQSAIQRCNFLSTR